MISTRGRYAIRFMLDLAENNSGRSVPLKESAERQGISKKYLEIIARDLVTGNLITGASGRGGGYLLRRKPEEYPLDEILELMEGTLSTVSCLTAEENPCPRRESCQTLPLWTEFDRLVRDFFHSRTLADLIRK